jgi:hypothetical protein
MLEVVLLLAQADMAAERSFVLVEYGGGLEQERLVLEFICENSGCGGTFVSTGEKIVRWMGDGRCRYDRSGWA